MARIAGVDLPREKRVEIGLLPSQRFLLSAFLPDFTQFFAQKSYAPKAFS